MGQQQCKQNQIQIDYSIFQVRIDGSTLLKHRLSGEELILRKFTSDLDQQVHEFEIMLKKRTKIQNPHLLKIVKVHQKDIKNVCSITHQIYILAEHPFQTLNDQIGFRVMRNQQKYFQEEQLISLLYSCSLGLSMLYKDQLMHQSLDSSCIFINANGIIQIGDPVVLHLEKNYSYFMKNKEKKIHISPQIVNFHQDHNFCYYDKEKSDVFVLGIIILQAALLTNIDPLKQHSTQNQITKLQQQLKNLSLIYSPFVAFIFSQLLKSEPALRPTFNQIINIIQNSVQQKKSQFIPSTCSQNIKLNNNSNTSQKNTNSINRQNIINNAKQPCKSMIKVQFNTFQIPFNHHSHFKHQTTISKQLVKPFPLFHQKHVIFNTPKFSPYVNLDKQFQNVQIKQTNNNFNESKKQEKKVIKIMQPNPQKNNRIRNPFFKQDIKNQVYKCSNVPLPYTQVLTQKVSQKKQPQKVQQILRVNKQKSDFSNKNSQENRSEDWLKIIKIKRSQLQSKVYSSLSQGYFQQRPETMYNNVTQLNSIREYNYPKTQIQIKTIKLKEQNTIRKSDKVSNKLISIQNDLQCDSISKGKQKQQSLLSVKVSEKEKIKSTLQYRVNKKEENQKEKCSSEVSFENTLLHQSIICEPQFALSNERQNKQMEARFVSEDLLGGGKYTGMKLGDKRQGQGRLQFQDGGYYEGNWSNNKINGYGKLYYDNGQLAYEGYWVNQQFCGKGKIYNDQPDKIQQPFNYEDFTNIMDKWVSYEGDFVQNMKHGKGKIQLTNGEQFQGSFLYDIIDGEGCFINLQRNIIKGIWKQNKYQHQDQRTSLL